jgi:hypothetical protein
MKTLIEQFFEDCEKQKPEKAKPKKLNIITTRKD